MSLIYSFLVCGGVCLISEIILNHSKLTPGHVTSLFASFGALLAFFNLYNPLIKKANMGAIILISNFGNSLYEAGLKGFYKNGIIGLFQNIFCKSSLVISSTIIFSFIFVCIFKSKD